MDRSLFLHLVLYLFILTFFSCEQSKEVKFPVWGTGAGLIAHNNASQEGRLDFSAPVILEYQFDESFSVPPNSSLQIEYELDSPLYPAAQESFSLVLNTGTASWQLPMGHNVIYFYNIPIEDSFDGYFNIMLETNEEIEADTGPVFTIRSISFQNRFFGFSRPSQRVFYSSPFVYREGSSYVIDVPSSFWPSPAYAGIEASFSDAGAVLEFTGRRIETIPGAQNISISHALYSPLGHALLSSEEVESFYITVFQAPLAFPQPILADPVLVLEWPRDQWRDPRFEVFQWDRFQPIPLIFFDFADYDMQSRMLKRLAFFVEKAGFRGRLAHDHEIADLHGWNAHDYRAEDLARFFDTARKSNFPLLDEEWELEEILLAQGIIRQEQGNIVAGAGAIMSIAREAPNHLRYRFMVHEGFHGLFFIDEGFRNFSRYRWEQFPAAAKRFLLAYFDFQNYDTQDEYLVLKEFNAHILQQPVSQAADYFGRLLPLRLENTEFASQLPQKNAASGTWPGLAAVFTSEAQVFSDYVNERWGLAAGRVWGLRVRQP
jgi:hypothetical protein